MIRNIRRSRGAFSLMELALTLIVALVIMVAIIAAYNYYREQSRISAAEQDAASIITAVHSMNAGQRDYSEISTSGVASSGMVPGDVTNGQPTGTMVDPFTNGQITVAPATQ